MSILYQYPQSHRDALRESQAIPAGLDRPFPSYLNLDSIEAWAKYERLLFACLITGNEKAAHLCLEALTTRFGASNERVQGLRGIYHEATAESNQSLDEILKGYDGMLSENPSDTVTRSNHCKRNASQA